MIGSCRWDNRSCLSLSDAPHDDVGGAPRGRSDQVPGSGGSQRQRPHIGDVGLRPDIRCGSHGQDPRPARQPVNWRRSGWRRSRVMRARPWLRPRVHWPRGRCRTFSSGGMGPICARTCHGAGQAGAVRLRDHDLSPGLRAPDRPCLQSYGPAWIADFATARTSRPALGLGVSGWAPSTAGDLERLVVQHADAVSAVTQPIADDLAERFSRPVTTITDGFDPDSVAAPMRTARDISRAIAGHWSTPARCLTEGARSSPWSRRSGSCTAPHQAPPRHWRSRSRTP